MAKQLSIETLQQLIWDLRSEVESLKKQVHQYEEHTESLKEQVHQYERRMEALEKENLMLKEKLAKYENPKNSNNSSIPPSKDENRPFKSKSLRKRTGRKPGGQEGHEGTTLEMVSEPDEIMDHIFDWILMDKTRTVPA